LTSVTNKSNLNIIIFESNYEMKNLKPGKGKKIRESFVKEYQSSIAICVK
jgi:hypothetical protein